MSQQRYLDFIHAAQAEGLLPESATPQKIALVPWPVMVMTALGAWIATIPLVAALHLMSDGRVTKAPGAYVVGAVLVLSGLFLLRKENRSLFMEQFILAALVLVGLIHLCLALGTEFSDSTSYLLMVPVMVILGWATQRRWLQSLFGALACGCLLRGFSWWEAAHVALGVSILFYWSLHFEGTKAAARIYAIAAGWTAVVLLGLVQSGGSASFFNGILELDINGPDADLSPPYAPITSALLALGAAAWAGFRWRSLIRLQFAVVAVIIAALAWFIPALGGVFVVLAFCVTSRRQILAGAAGAAAVFALSAFYYQPYVPLWSKAEIMISAGVALSAIAWFTLARNRPQPPVGSSLETGSSLGIVLGLLVVLAAVNLSIWQNENLISTGTPVLVELEPVESRSLMQGDIMRLRFSMPDRYDTKGNSTVSNAHRNVVGQRDERGVTKLTRFDDGGALKSGELKIALIKNNGDWSLITDAWHFAEGGADQWEAARYGEFRVAPTGKALLVGLRDDKLRPIR